MSNVSEPSPAPDPKPSKKKRVRQLADSLIDWRNVNDVSRRFALTMELLDVLDSHEVSADSSDEENHSDALAVFQATSAFLMASFAIPEKEACQSYRGLYRVMKAAHKRLTKTGGTATAREVFTEVALDVEEPE